MKLNQAVYKISR